MIFRQFLHTAPIGASYLFGCGGQGQCVVVDPVEDLAAYLDASRETGMRIMHVIDSHVHADHRSGGRALAEASGAAYLVHESVAGARPHPRSGSNGALIARSPPIIVTRSCG